MNHAKSVKPDQSEESVKNVRNPNGIGGRDLNPLTIESERSVTVSVSTE